MADKTLEYYNSHAKEYVGSTIHTDMSSVWNAFEQQLPQGGCILDLGCGSGRDTLYFLEAGFSVTSVDGSAEICRIAEVNYGIKVRNILFQKLDYNECFDGVWACASLLHVRRDEICEVIEKVFQSLKEGGVFYTCFKYGEEEYTDDKGRYFNCYTEDSIEEIFKSVETMTEVIDIWITGDNLENRSLQWVNVMVKKNR